MIKYETILSENCKIFTDQIDPSSLGMIKALLDSDIGKDAIIRIMPDVHAGPGCVIGTSLMSRNKISPILLGGDIGCGVSAVKLAGKPKIALEKLDKFIRSEIPYGMNIRNKNIKEREVWIREFVLDVLTCRNFDIDKALRSIGTLGGGNHFIELGISEDMNGKSEYWLIIHSGSRHLGTEIIDYYKEEAKAQHPEIPYEFAYLTGNQAMDFYQDVGRVSNFASENRGAIINEICKAMKWKISYDQISCTHNSIRIASDGVGEDGNPIVYYHLRKGCIRACEHDQVIIPINMKEGCIIGKGKSNSDWNNSAPHGAGRFLTREQARNSLTLTQYKKEMEGIYSSSISRSTIDESPMAYKSLDYITDRIKDTVEIEKIIKPIYNFKAEGENND